jgi:hypothetical protein
LLSFANSSKTRNRYAHRGAKADCSADETVASAQVLPVIDYACRLAGERSKSPQPACLNEAVSATTRVIPIVFQVGSDLIAAGLVMSLSRPGGNVTGVTNMNTELGPKRLKLLRELIPTAKVIALLVNPSSRFIAETMSRELQSAAREMGIVAGGLFAGKMHALCNQHERK